MTELTYHDGHYHRGEESRRSRDESAGSGGNSGGLLRKTHDAWDKVLYGIGTAYFKLCGR